MISKTSKAVDEMLCTSLVKEKTDNRKAMLTTISTICFLACQGLPLRGSHVSSGGCEMNSNFYIYVRKIYLCLILGYKDHKIILLVLVFKMSCLKSWQI